jgi:hypothetical protein
MASGWFNHGKRLILEGAIDLTNDTIKVIILNGYTFDNSQDTTGNGAGSVDFAEVESASYVGGHAGSGRKTLGTKTFSEEDGATDRGEFHAAATVWTALNNVTIGGLCLVKEVSSDSDGIPIAYIDNAAQFPITTNGGDITINWNADGILQLG